MNGRFIVNVMFMGTRNDSFLDLATVIVVLCEVCVSVCVCGGGDFSATLLIKHSNLVLLLFYVTKGEQAK